MADDKDIPKVGKRIQILDYLRLSADRQAIDKPFSVNQSILLDNSKKLCQNNQFIAYQTQLPKTNENIITRQVNVDYSLHCCHIY